MKKSILSAMAIGLLSDFNSGGGYRYSCHWRNRGRKRTTTATQQKRDKIKRKNKGK